jgi:ubiquinone/menaquinone biosynthesis C-methylase UbiE
MGKYEISQEQRDKYEAEFFDRVVSEKDLSDLRISGEMLETLARILKELGLEFDEAQGKNVLDCGCGTGLLTVYLAMQGCNAHGIDVSEESVKVTLQRARTYGLEPRVHAQVMSIENMTYQSNWFDRVVGKFVLHHVDVERAGREIHRVLKPGGHAIFYENSANNGLLMASRRLLTGRFGVPKVSDDIEHPLRRSEISVLRRIFKGNVRSYYPDFVFFRLVDGYILRGRSKLLSSVLAALDQAVYRYAPFLRQYGYFQIVVLEKMTETQEAGAARAPVGASGVSV